MRYYDNDSVFDTKFEKFFQGHCSLSETVELCINASYYHTLRYFTSLFNQDFFDELARQATPIEIYMIYLDYYHATEIEWVNLRHFVERHASYAGDIVLLQHFYQKSDLENFCDSDGVLMTLYMAETFLSQKNRLIIEHLDDYISTISDIQHQNNEMPLFIG